jgi:hypothetical protein
MNWDWRKSKYVKTIEGIGTGIDQDGWWGFQCKDLVNAYAEDKGHPLTAGDARTAWEVEQDPWWQKIPYDRNAEIKVGDIVVHKPSALNGWSGHIEIVDRVDKDRGTMAQWHAIAQNWVNANSEYGSPPANVLQNSTNTPIYGVLRPKEVDMPKKVDLQTALNLAEALQGDDPNRPGVKDDLIRNHVGKDLTPDYINQWHDKPASINWRKQIAGWRSYSQVWNENKIRELKKAATDNDSDKVAKFMEQMVKELDDIEQAIKTKG